MTSKTTQWLVRLVAVIFAVAGIYLFKQGQTVVGYVLAAIVVVLAVYDSILSKKIKVEAAQQV